jgi:hypothetical protein
MDEKERALKNVTSYIPIRREFLLKWQRITEIHNLWHNSQLWPVPFFRQFDDGFSAWRLGFSSQITLCDIYGKRKGFGSKLFKFLCCSFVILHSTTALYPTINTVCGMQ